MFGNNNLINFCTFLVLSSLMGLSFAAPIPRGVETLQVVKRQDAPPTVADGTINAGLVHLLDEYNNLEKEVSDATKHSPIHDEATKGLASVKALLESGISGIALATSTLPIPTASTITGSSTITATPSSSNSSKAPIVTVVTQEGTSIVVLASQGTTTTVSLATLTALPASTSTATSSSSTSTSNSASETATVTGTSTVSSTPTGATATGNKTDGSNSAGVRLAVSINMLASTVAAVVLGVWMVL